MQRDRFAPVPETQATRDEPGLTAIRTGFGTPARLVTRYADVREVLGDAERFTNTGLPRLPMPERRDPTRAPGTCSLTDPPEHTRLRRLLTGEFTVKRIRRLEPRIVEIVDDHLDAMAAAGPPADLVSAFALPVPSLVICELLGVPYDDRAEFQGRAARQVDLSLPLEERGRVAAGVAHLHGRARRPRADRARATTCSACSCASTATTSRARSSIGIASLLLIAGHETTANMLGLGTLALLRAPEQLALVRDEPGAVAPAIEELLRFLSVVHSGDPAHRPRTTRRSATCRWPRASSSCSRCPPPTATPRRSSTPTTSTSPARSPRTSRSGTACTTAWARPWPAPRWPWRSPRCSGASRRSRSGIPFEEIEFRSATIVHGLRALPVTW